MHLMSASWLSASWFVTEMSVSPLGDLIFQVTTSVRSYIQDQSRIQSDLQEHTEYLVWDQT